MSELEKIVLNMAKREVMNWKPFPRMQPNGTIKINIPDRCRDTQTPKDGAEK